MTRRVAMFLAAVVTALVLAGGVALAASVRCAGGDCKGTPGADQMLGTVQRDVMRAFGGNDKMYAKTGDDNLRGFDGNDHAVGGAGDDSLYGDWGVDRLYGTQGSDSLDGGGGHDGLYGGKGDDELLESTEYSSYDVLDGGVGDDVHDGGDADSFFYFGPGWGHDTITGSSGPGHYVDFSYTPPGSIWRGSGPWCTCVAT